MPAPRRAYRKPAFEAVKPSFSAPGNPPRPFEQCTLTLRSKTLGKSLVTLSFTPRRDDVFLERLYVGGPELLSRGASHLPKKSSLHLGTLALKHLAQWMRRENERRVTRAGSGGKELRGVELEPYTIKEFDEFAYPPLKFYKKLGFHNEWDKEGKTHFRSNLEQIETGVSRLLGANKKPDRPKP